MSRDTALGELNFFGTARTAEQNALNAKVQEAAQLVRNHHRAHKAGTLSSTEELAFQEACDFLDLHAIGGSDELLMEL